MPKRIWPKYLSTHLRMHNDFLTNSLCWWSDTIHALLMTSFLERSIPYANILDFVGMQLLMLKTCLNLSLPLLTLSHAWLHYLQSQTLKSNLSPLTFFPLNFHIISSHQEQWWEISSWLPSSTHFPTRESITYQGPKIRPWKSSRPRYQHSRCA